MADFKKAAELDRKHGEDYAEDHHSYFFRGLAYGFAKQKKRAKADLEQALKLAIELKDSFYEGTVKATLEKL